MSITGEVEIDYIDMVDGDDRDWTSFQDGMEDMLTDWARDESKELYQRLYKYYEELQEDEAVADTLIAGDYDFNLDGDIV